MRPPDDPAAASARGQSASFAQHHLDNLRSIQRIET